MFLSRTALFAVTVSLVTSTGIAFAQAGTSKPAAKPAAAAPAPKLPAGVAARFNGTDITYAELNQIVKSWAGRPVLQQVVQQKMIEQEAKKNGVTVTPAELSAEIARIKQQQVQANSQGATNGMMAWSTIAKRDGISDMFVSDNVRVGLLARKTYAKVVETMVAKSPAASLNGQIKVAHILIATRDLNAAPNATPPSPEEQKKLDDAAKAKADVVLADVKSGKITFADAAKQNSQDPGSAANGGEMDYVPKGTFVKEFDDAAFKLDKPGDITPEPVKTQFGYHIIKLIAKGSAATAAEKTAYRKKLIDQQMQNPNGIQQWMQSLMSTAKVTYNPTVAVAPAPAKKP